MSSYAQIDKTTNKILNNITVDYSYRFSADYLWADSSDYNVEIGDYYIEGKFYKADKTTEITKNKSLTDEIQELKQANAELEQQNTEISQVILDMQVKQSLKDMGV